MSSFVLLLFVVIFGSWNKSLELFVGVGIRVLNFFCWSWNKGLEICVGVGIKVLSILLELE